MISTRHIERIRGAFCDDALYRFTFTFTLEKKQATVKQIGKRKKIITLSASGDLSKRSVIFTEETVCGRERVTSDEEWVLEGVDKDQAGKMCSFCVWTAFTITGPDRTYHASRSIF